MDLQNFFEAMSEQDRKTRSGYHLTLGELIDVLEETQTEIVVEFMDGGYPQNAHSYRGYYSDLAFEEGQVPRTAGELLIECKTALGKVFEGYKGGEFRMHKDTPLWSASYGSCGQAVICCMPGKGRLVLIRKDVD